MKYTISNNLIEKSWFEDKIHATLMLYDRGKDTLNSPLIEFQRNWESGGGMHADCADATSYDKCIHERQERVFELYESIKKDGYNGSEILCFFDDDGILHPYDGHHRLSILSYLGVEANINVETEWNGLNADRYSPKDSNDFPLVKKLTLPSGRVRLYQPIDDPRLDGIKTERPDSEKRLEFILSHIQGNKVLDIGCSEGYFSRPLLEKGYDVLGVDIDPNYLSVARYLSQRAT